MKKIKDIIKKNPVANATFGTDPSNPWATKYNVTEATETELLARYLNSRGVNPRFVTRDTKIAHAKSSEYAKWKADHIERFAREEVEQVSEGKKPKMTALDKFRKAAAEREKKHSQYEKPTGDLKGAIDRLEKHLNKEEVINEVSSSEVQHHFDNWTNSEHAPYNSDAGDDNKVHQSALRYLRSTNVPKEKHEKMAMHIAHKFHGSGIDEEVEQIDELKKSTVFSWLKQQPVVPEKKPGMTRKDFNKKIKTHSKSWNRALDRLAGYKPTSEAAGISKTKETQFHKKLDTLVHNTFGKRKDELKMKEDAFQDTQAATQMPFDGANTTNDTDMKKREMTKSARIIKSIYKRKSMKEDMHDWEKEDKSVQSYGKKPKLDMTDKKSNIGENKPEARAVMTGGKTLTGQPRDMVEIDPSMKNRPDRPDTFDKGNPKKSPA